MKTKEELNVLKQECEKLDSKLRELSEDELDQVTGGASKLAGYVPGFGVGVLMGGVFSMFANSTNLVCGRTSQLQDNNPLYIIDGVPTKGGMHELNGNDIEAIQVLKDATPNNKL